MMPTRKNSRKRYCLPKFAETPDLRQLPLKIFAEYWNLTKGQIDKTSGISDFIGVRLAKQQMCLNYPSLSFSRIILVLANFRNRLSLTFVLIVNVTKKQWIKSMRHYFLNTNAQLTGEHEIHREGCKYLPSVENRIRLGKHSSCFPALTTAWALKPSWDIDGCYFCCHDCHKQ